MATRKVVMETLYFQKAGLEVDVSDLMNVVVEYVGTWAGTVAVQISQDGVYWTTPTNMTPAIAVGHYDVPSGTKFVRVNCTAYTSGAVQCFLTGDEYQMPKRFGTLGDLTSATSGAAFYVGDLTEVFVQIAGRAVGTFAYTATTVVDVSQDGTRWAPAAGVSTFVNVSGTVEINSKVQYVRVRTSGYTQGIASARVGGINYNSMPGSPFTSVPRFGTMGDLAGAAANAAVDVSDLDDVAVTITFTGGANMTVSIEQLVGTFWVPVPGATGFAAGTNVTFEMPGPAQQIRLNQTAYVGGTCYARFGGATPMI